MAKTSSNTSPSAGRRYLICVQRGSSGRVTLDTVSSSLSEIADLLESGHGITNVFSGLKPKQIDFIGSEIMFFSFHSALSVDEQLSYLRSAGIGGIVFSLNSDKTHASSFLWLIPLSRRITTSDELRWVRRAISNFLRIQSEPSEETRVFKITAGSKRYSLGEHPLESERIDFFSADGERDTLSDTISNASSVGATISAVSLHPSQRFMRVDGSEVRLDEISSFLKVCCPFHIGSDGDSFVNRNSAGKAYHFCTICNKTRWEAGGSAGIFSSISFEEQLLSLAAQSRKKLPLENLSGATLRPFFGEDSSPAFASIEIQDAPYLKFSHIPNGLTFIKSGKGTGKTEAIANHVKRKVSKSNTKESVLLIGHRQSLIRNLCVRLGLNCYLDDQRGTTSGEVQRFYGVCLDSLLKVRNLQYEMIVIDEVEQVLAHFLSGTLESSAFEIFCFFAKLISNAKSVVVLDADLSWTSFLTLSEMRRSDLSSPPAVQFIVNRWRSSGRSLDFYSDKNQLTGLLKQRLREGKRVFVASNSKSEIDRLSFAIRKEWQDSELSPLRIIAITSANSSKPEIQQFITYIQTEILKFDLVLCSPSVSTGVDISFELGEACIDSVIGFFETRINIHTEIDQQISRVRNPKETAVWVSPSRFNFETQFEVIRSDTLRSKLALVTVPLKDLIECHSFVSESAKFLQLISLVTLNRRASINNLRDNFVRYKKWQGVSVNHVSTTAQTRSEGKYLQSIGKQLSNFAFRESIFSANEISYERYKKLKLDIKVDPTSVPEAARRECFRFELEWFYLQPVTSELLSLDDRWRYRIKVKRFHLITRPPILKCFTKFHDTYLFEIGEVGRALKKVKYADLLLLSYLFSLCPFFNDRKFDCGISFKNDDLQTFARTCKKLRGVIEGQLDMVVRLDVEQKAVSQLKQFLKYVALDVVKVKNEVRNGLKTYFYRIDPLALATAESVSCLIDIRREVFADEGEEDNE